MIALTEFFSVKVSSHVIQGSQASMVRDTSLAAVEAKIGKALGSDFAFAILVRVGGIGDTNRFCFSQPGQQGAREGKCCGSSTPAAV